MGGGGGGRWERLCFAFPEKKISPNLIEKYYWPERCKKLIWSCSYQPGISVKLIYKNIPFCIVSKISNARNTPSHLNSNRQALKIEKKCGFYFKYSFKSSQYPINIFHQILLIKWY